MNDPLGLSDQSCDASPRAPRAMMRRASNSRNHFTLFWLAMSAAALLVPGSAIADSDSLCTGNITEGCDNPGAECNPVEEGIGEKGHCITSGLPREEKECKCVGMPAPDPCRNRNAKGKIVCTINKPVVTEHEREIPSVVFAPGDIVDVTADGCVQTGGVGDTWKRYVNPWGSGPDPKYHGLIRIPTAEPAGSGLVPIQSVVGGLQTVTGAGVGVSQLVLHLGYEDDDYSDNGYSEHDDGNDDQCKMTGSNDGGPAHVTITIYRGTPLLDFPPPKVAQSRFDFDVISTRADRLGFPQWDPNGLPLNPQWSWQLRPENLRQTPRGSICHELRKRALWLNAFLPPPLPPVPIIAVPSFPDCTDQTDLNGVDLPGGENERLCRLRKLVVDRDLTGSGGFAGHVNWFPVTVEGAIPSKAVHEGFPFGDDDYTFSFISDLPGSPLSVNGSDALHVEFDASETINNFKSGEWVKLREAMDGDDGELKKRLFAGHTILTGMFGLDGEHEYKAELHPLYAIATRLAFNNTPADDDWLIFVRNRGDEGYCSSWLWDAGFEDYTFHLPWLPGMTDVDVNWSKTEFEGTDGTSGPTIAKILPPAKDAGVYVTFHLGPAASSPFRDGALHLTWTGNAIAMPPVIGTSGIADSEEAGEAETT
jgi:hypothetical protein